MKKEMKIVLPFYKIAYAVSFVVILSLIRGVVFTNEIGLSIEAPFAILTAVFCADTYVQEITSKRSEIHRLYPIRKRICSIMQRIMIQEFFLLLLAVLPGICGSRSSPSSTLSLRSAGGAIRPAACSSSFSSVRMSPTLPSS